MFGFCIKLLYWKKKIWILFYFDNFLASDGIPALLICTLFFLLILWFLGCFQVMPGVFQGSFQQILSCFCVFNWARISFQSLSSELLQGLISSFSFSAFSVLTFVHALLVSLKPAKRAFCACRREVWTTSFAIGAASQSQQHRCFYFY